MIENNVFTVNSLKFDGRIHRSWKANLIKETENLIIFEGIFDKEINHTQLGVIKRGTTSYEYYWKKGWYNVFRFHEPEGEFRNFYCNINQPPVIENNVLNYIDLDVDILIWQDLTFEILDWDEFQANVERFNYSLKLQKKVRQSLNEILNLLENRYFPFDFRLEI
jgi:protein associated with RNAse G/E